MGGGGGDAGSWLYDGVLRLVCDLSERESLILAGSHLVVHL
jgi:hypothetical protein